MVTDLTKIWISNIDKKAAKVRAMRILKVIKKYHKRPKNILELGVGLGVVLAHFKKYNMYGLDLKKDFIKSAKNIVPNAKLFIQSMHNFKIRNRFDIIFSVHECINEVKPYKNWEATFKSSYNHLNEGGLFIFDMRTKKHLEFLKKQTVKLERNPSGYVYDNTVVKGHKLTWNTIYFKRIKKDLYKIEKDRYSEFVYPVSKVKKSLSKDFKVLEAISFEKGHKVMFVCRKL
ncbi:class I SAM-dependent methyltransferase [archaeon]|nr:class I SAM-dependent methyltransferase [archaeon]MBT4416641.1 class I SAM-dependent methyltransferase [archaeon]